MDTPARFFLTTESRAGTGRSPGLGQPTPLPQHRMPSSGPAEAANPGLHPCGRRPGAPGGVLPQWVQVAHCGWTVNYRESQTPTACPLWVGRKSRLGEVTRRIWTQAVGIQPLEGLGGRRGCKQTARAHQRTLTGPGGQVAGGEGGSFPSGHLSPVHSLSHTHTLCPLLAPTFLTLFYRTCPPTRGHALLSLLPSASGPPVPCSGQKGCSPDWAAMASRPHR